MINLSKVRHTLFVIFVSAIILSLFTYGIFGKDFSIEDIRFFAQNLGLWLPISFIIIYTFTSIFLPTTPLMAIAGIIFGFKYGMLYTTIGGFLSSFLVFYVARFLGRDFVDKLLSNKFLSKIEKYNERLEKHGIFTVIVLRMTPIMPFNLLNLLMGVSKVRSFDYIAGTLIGLAPSNLLTVYFGELIFKFVSGKIAASLLGLLFLLGLIYVISERRKRG